MLTLWRNPDRTLAALNEQMDRLVSGIAGNAWSYGLTPAADVLETEGDYRVLVDLPGIDPGAIQLRVEKDVLTIEVDRKQPQAPPPARPCTGASAPSGRSPAPSPCPAASTPPASRPPTSRACSR